MGLNFNEIYKYKGFDLITIKNRFIAPTRDNNYVSVTDQFVVKKTQDNKIYYLKLTERPFVNEVNLINVSDGQNLYTYAENISSLGASNFTYDDIDLIKGYIAIQSLTGNGEEYIVTVSYKGLGSVVSAEDINELKTGALTHTEFSFNGNVKIPNGTLDLNNNKIINLSDPSGALDAVNKRYVDNVAHGLTWQKPVKAIVTSSLPSNPNDGDRYLINISGNNNLNKIAEWQYNHWEYIAPESNWTLFVEDSDTAYTYNSESTTDFKWVAIARPMLLPNGITGQTLKYNTDGWGSTSEIFISNGNIGINNTNPLYNLDVNGSINASAFYLNGQPFSGGSGNIIQSGDSSVLVSDSGSGEIKFKIDNNDISKIDSTGFFVNDIRNINFGQDINFYNNIDLKNNDLKGVRNIYSYNTNGSLNIYATDIIVGKTLQFSDGSGCKIIAGSGSSNVPTITYDTDNKWKYSNDGVNFLEIGSGSAIEKVTTLPTPDSSKRGKLVYLEGTIDKLYCCMKDSYNNYSWVLIAIGE